MRTQTSKTKKTLNIAMQLLCLILLVVTLLIFKSCKPITSFMAPLSNQVQQEIVLEHPEHHPELKTIILVADNKGTEIFDLLAPFDILKSTVNANVYIVAKEAKHIPLHRGLLIAPHHTFQSFKDLGVQPDAIIVPNLSTIDPDDMDKDISNFIRSIYLANTLVLSVCDGAATVASSELFEQREMTAHASDIAYLKKEFPMITWVKDRKFNVSSNLISTAGVSNATEGTLVLLNKLYGLNEVKTAMDLFNYKSNSILDMHQSEPITFTDKLVILSKVAFKSNKNIGVQIEEGVSTFQLAAIIDTYSRTFPESINTFSVEGKPVISKNGLTLIPTSTKHENLDVKICIECNVEDFKMKDSEFIVVEIPRKEYMFDYLLKNHISKEFSDSFTRVVSRLLDYNFKP